MLSEFGAISVRLRLSLPNTVYVEVFAKLILAKCISDLECLRERSRLFGLVASATVAVHPSLMEVLSSPAFQMMCLSVLQTNAHRAYKSARR